LVLIIRLTFIKVQLSRNYEQAMLKFVIHSIAIAKLGTIFSVVREITRMRTELKTCNFIVKSLNRAKVYVKHYKHEHI